MKYQKLLKLYFILGIILLFTGCNGDNSPENLISEDTYIKLIVELQLIESAGETVDSDSLNTEQLTKRVFEKYGVTRKQFIRSHRHYSDDIDNQKKRLKKALEFLQQQTSSPKDTTKSRRSRPSTKKSKP